MPIYEYRCKKCGDQQEVFLKMADRQPTKCRKCGGRLEKLISSPAIQFKGEGWYVTDYARKGSGAEKVEKEGSSSDSGAGGDGATRDKSRGDKEKTKKTTKKADQG